MAAICCGLLASCSLFHRTSFLEDEMTLRNLTEQEYLQKEANKRQLREEILKAFENIRTLVGALSADPFPCMFLTDTEIFINMDDAHVRASQAKIHTPMPDIRPAEDALEQEIYMLVPYAKDSRWQPVREKLRYVQDTRWTDLALDVYSQRCGKDQGIRATCRLYGLDESEVLAVGGGPNDEALLNACGWKAAMGNAVEEL